MISSQDLVVIGILVFLEGILSIDNALVLALLAKPLPKAQQKRALTYGLLGAVVFRLMAIGAATFLMKWRWVKFAGGAYLLWLGGKYFLRHAMPHSPDKLVKPRSFWMTVLVIELTDIAFAVDSILAAVALTPKFWVVFTGGFIGVVLLRFAATGFIKLLEKFPSFETTAYLLIILIGLKVIIDGLHIPGVGFHSPEQPAFWVFWGLMGVCFLYGFKPLKDKTRHINQ